MIKDHPLLGQPIEYQCGGKSLHGKVSAVKAGPMMADGNSIVGNVKVMATVKLRITPDDGAPDIWSAPMRYTTPNATSHRSAACGASGGLPGYAEAGDKEER